jgi:hypothetical protein
MAANFFTNSSGDIIVNNSGALGSSVANTSRVTTSRVTSDALKLRNNLQLLNVAS